MTTYTMPPLGPQQNFLCQVSAVPVAFMSKLFASFRPGFPLVRLGMAVLAAVFFHFSAVAAAPSLTGGGLANRSFTELRDAAGKGDPVAQRLVANAYLTGEGVKQDLVEAVKWLRLSAEQRDPLAQYVLGILHDEGRGVPQDLREAVKWYERAALQGLPDAQFNLALCYAKGEGLPKDSKKAAEWLLKAATAGDSQAQSRLGLAYITGNGVERNPTEAAIWLRKAAYPPGEDAKAQFFLGRLYQEGEGVTQSAAEAVRWFRSSAQQGYADAQFHLGRVLLAGEGVERNVTEGRAWMEKAAAQRHEAAVQFMAQAAGGQPSPTASPAGMSPMTAAASGQGAGRTPSAAFSSRAATGREAPFTAPPSTSGLTFSAPGQDTNLNPSAIGMREPLPATPTLPPPGKAMAPASTKPAVADTTGKEPSLPPFTAPPVAKEPAPATATRDLFTLPPGGADTNPGSLFTEPPRPREPQPEPRPREVAPVSIPAPHSSGDHDLKWIAIVSALISAAILFLGIYMLYAFQTRLRGLEAELKKAQFELSKANVNLSAMMHQVEQLALAAPAPAPKTSLPEWNPEPAKTHASSFKMHRSK